MRSHGVTRWSLLHESLHGYQRVTYGSVYKSRVFWKCGNQYPVGRVNMSLFKKCQNRVSHTKIGCVWASVGETYLFHGKILRLKMVLCCGRVKTHTRMFLEGSQGMVQVSWSIKKITNSSGLWSVWDIIRHIPMCIFTSVAELIHHTDVHLQQKYTTNNSTSPWNVICFQVTLKTMLTPRSLMPGTSSALEQGQEFF